MGIAHSNVTDERDSRYGAKHAFIPNGIVNAVCGLLIGGHLAEHVGGTYAEIVVLIPISAGAGTDVGVGSGHVVANHGFTKAGAVIAPVGSQTAVAHGQERLIYIGKVVRVADTE